MELEYYYKIMDYEEGKLKTLFHGLNGSRTIPMFEWLKARVEVVSDGSGGTKYMSGWHVFEKYDECLKYLKYFKNLKPKVIAKCKAQKLWPKKHSKADVLLAEWLYVVNISGGKQIESNCI
jgi:hypothetical protein